MRYFFIVNGREDKQSILPRIESQLEGLDLQYDIYVTTGVGDGTRFTRIWCDLHPQEKACFVACGGSGTVNEVASGIVGFEGKSMAVLAYGTTNDFIKYYPGRDFRSVRDLLDGEDCRIDIIKANDSYSVNMINCGFDEAVAYRADRYIQEGRSNAYLKGVLGALLFSRRHSIKVVADGVPLNRRNLLLCTLSNGRYCGGQFLAAPRAVNDDGLIDVCLFHTMSLLMFGLVFKRYMKGLHLEDRLCRRHLEYVQARHVELRSKDLIYLSPDGEIVAARNFTVDLLPKALTLRLPKAND